MAPRKKTTTDDTKTIIGAPADSVKKEEKPLSPSEYFNILNEKMHEAKDADITALFQNATKLMKKYTVTGQKAGAMKLYKFAQLCEAELKVVRAGYTQYVNRQDLDEYISKIADKAVVISALEDFERDIPDDVVEKIADAKEQHLFDEYYVVFTDYTGKERKKIEAERREKDPILFGILKIGEQVSTRLYHIASWEDQYCDLTLDKMVKEFDSKNTGEDGTSMLKSLTEQFGSYDDFKKAFGDMK